MKLLVPSIGSITQVSGDFPPRGHVLRRGCHVWIRALDGVTDDRLPRRDRRRHRVVAHEVALVLHRDDFAEVRQDRRARGHARCAGEFEIPARFAGVMRFPSSSISRSAVAREHVLPRAGIVALREPLRRCPRSWPRAAACATPRARAFVQSICHEPRLIGERRWESTAEAPSTAATLCSSSAASSIHAARGASLRRPRRALAPANRTSIGRPGCSR